MNTMPQPPLRYCRRCGARLRVLNIGPTPVSGLPGHTQMTANMVCPDCGLTDGVSWSTLKPATSFPPDDALRRYVRGRQKPIFQNEDGGLDFAGLVDFMPFPVLGVEGHPYELRFRSVIYGSNISRDRPEPRHHLQLDHVAGDRRNPMRGLTIIQNRPLPEQDIVQSVVTRLCSLQQRTRYIADWDFNRDWNEQKVADAERFSPVVNICGQRTNVAIAQWEEPQLVLLASLELGGVPYAVASMNLPRPDFVKVLEKLAVLNDDNEVKQRYAQEYDIIWRDRKSRRDS